MIHIRYIRYMVLHKWFVLVAGLKTGAPLWRLIIHDASKFRPSEWIPYARSFYGGWKYDERPASVVAAFDRAWNYHQKRNPHHWQFWLLVNDNPGRLITTYDLVDSAVKWRVMDEEMALPMPEKFIREMVADWAGAGRAITGKWEVRDWYEKNKENMILHPRTRARVEELLRKF